MRDCTRSRAPARIDSASGAGEAPCAGGGVETRACSALIAPSKVMPWAPSTCAARLLPSPTIAASTMAPLISRRRPPRAAAAAASRIRRRSSDTPSSACCASGWGGMPASCPSTSPISSATLTLLAASTSTASGSSHSDSRICSSETSIWPRARAWSVARDREAASPEDMAIRLKSSAIMNGLPKAWLLRCGGRYSCIASTMPSSRRMWGNSVGFCPLRHCANRGERKATGLGDGGRASI